MNDAPVPADVSPGLIVFVMTVLTSSLAAWLWIFRRWQTGQPLLAFEPRRAVPWGFTDAGLILGGWLVLQVVCPDVCRRFAGIDPFTREEMSADQMQVLLRGSLVGSLLAGLLGFLWLNAVRGANFADLGLSARKSLGDLWCGAVAFAALAVPIYGIQLILVKWMDLPSHHPLITLLEERKETGTIVLAALTASIVAPLIEEFLFRLVLQGALEGAEFRAVPTEPAIPEQPAAAPLANVESVESNNLYQSPQVTGDSGEAAALAPSSVEESSSRGIIAALPSEPVWGLPVGVWPILVSAGLFALMHYQHGPDPIPLFVLAVALGYLYRQTHRILPSLVVHVMLNSCSLVALWLKP